MSIMSREEFAKRLAGSEHMFKNKTKERSKVKNTTHLMISTLDSMLDVITYERKALISCVDLLIGDKPAFQKSVKRLSSYVNSAQISIRILKAIEYELYTHLYKKEDDHKYSSLGCFLLSSYFSSGIWHPTHVDIVNHIVNTPDYFKIMIHGSPGTGKSSIIKVLETGMIYESKIFHYIDSMYNIPDKLSHKNVYIIEDIDLLVAHKREGGLDEKTAVKKLLDFLDKADKIIITTNQPNSLDDAIYRSGRIDTRYNVGNVDINELSSIIQQKLIAEPYKFPPNKLNEIDWAVNEMIEACVPDEKGFYKPCDVARVIREYVLTLIRTVNKCEFYSPDDLLRFIPTVPKETKREKIRNTASHVYEFLTDIRKITTALTEESKKEDSSTNSSGFFSKRWQVKKPEDKVRELREED